MLIRHNPLAYPAGKRAGIDPNHPAVSTGIGGVVFSAIARGGNFINLNNATLGTVAGLGMTQTIDAIGPVNVFANNTNLVTFPIPGVLNNSTTLAVSFRVAAVFNAGTNQYVISTFDTATGQGYALTILNGALNIVDTGGVVTALGPSVAVNTAYFVAVSILGGVSFNYVVVNLATGQRLSGTVAAPAATTFSKTLMMLGGRDDGGRPSVCSIAAGMMTINAASKQMSVGQLQQWAQDPWAFWYPNANTNLVGIAAGGFTPIYRKTLSSLGTRIGARQSQVA